MCGIFGCVGRPEDEARIREAVRRLAHRGPDAEGIERHPHPLGEAWLGFRRLAIQDPEPRGNQPMADATGRWRIVFNGEIYNFRELRAELEAKGDRFHTGTDTEVLLAAWLRWGPSALDRLVGMFAFAVLDTLTGELALARDRLGIKPLYYLSAPGRLAFASEVKAILALSGVERRVDPLAAARFFTFLWVPGPDTLLEGVRQVEPGSWLRVGADGAVEAHRYWEVPLPGAGGGGPRAPEPTPREAADRLEELLQEAVRVRLVSDVPLGAFLSGGVDSSLVVALMRRASGARVTTHTVLFPPADAGWHVEEDDTPWARRVRDWFGDGVAYHEHLLEPGMADLLPRMVWHLDDPVADPAALATWLICAAARPTTTVLLAGMGAEELFAGYPRHRAVLLAERYARVPGWLRRGVVEAVVARLPAGRAGRWLALSRRAKKFTASAALPFEERYLGYAGYYAPDELAALAPALPHEGAYGRHREHLARSRGLDPVARMTHLDLNTFLPSLNLAYTDRASMAASVEVRVPLLDHRVVEYVQGLPSALKLRGGRGKAVLKDVAARHLPRAVTERPKAGFQAPVRAWVSRDLKGRIQEVLSPERIRARGVLDPDAVWRVIRGQWEGREDNALRIWAFLTFELWAATFLDGDGGAPISW
ncbi:MAG: asparagine synthase (glutamine-hydrolyzing) [Longimicrobiales bacterium]